LNVDLPLRESGVTIYGNYPAGYLWY